MRCRKPKLVASGRCTLGCLDEDNTASISPVPAVGHSRLTRTVQMCLDTKQLHSNVPHCATLFSLVTFFERSSSLAACRHAIASLQLDVLVFTEIGRYCEWCACSLDRNETSGIEIEADGGIFVWCWSKSSFLIQVGTFLFSERKLCKRDLEASIISTRQAPGLSRRFCACLQEGLTPNALHITGSNRCG